MVGGELNITVKQVIREETLWVGGWRGSEGPAAPLERGHWAGAVAGRVRWRGGVPPWLWCRHGRARCAGTVHYCMYSTYVCVAFGRGAGAGGCTWSRRVFHIQFSLVPSFVRRHALWPSARQHSAEAQPGRHSTRDLRDFGTYVHPRRLMGRGATRRIDSGCWTGIDGGKGGWGCPGGAGPALRAVRMTLNTIHCWSAHPAASVRGGTPPLWGSLPRWPPWETNALEPEVRSGRLSRSTHHVMITDHSPLLSQTPPLASRPAVRSLC